MRKTLAWSLAGIAAICLGGSFALAYRISAPKLFLPAISLSSESLRFSQLKTGQQESANLTVANRGWSTLTISAIKVSCGCTEINSDFDSLSPGESREMRVTVSGRSTKTPQQNTITIFSNNPQFPQKQIQVEVQPAPMVGFEPGEIDFGRISAANLPTMEIVTLHLAKDSAVDVSAVKVSSDSRHVLCEIVGSNDRDHTLNLFVTLAKGVPTGEISNRLKVHLPDSEREYSANISGCVVGEYYALPGAVVFGPLRESDKPRVETIRIAARGAQNNEFSLLASGGNHWPVAGLQVSQGDPGQANEFTLTCDPRLWPAPWTSQRVRTSIQVKLTSNEGAEARLNIPVEVVLDR